MILVFPGLLLGLVAQQRALTAIAMGTLALLVVNLFWARRVSRKIGLSVSQQGAATVGEVHLMELTAIKPVGVDFEIRMAAYSDREWTWLRLPACCPFAIRPTHRGVFKAVPADIKTSFPLGLVSYRCPKELTMAQPFHVAPPAIEIDLPLQAAREERTAPLGNDDTVGLRDYAPGDQPRDIHWQSVARTGMLVVRERRGLSEPLSVTVVVDLSVANPGRPPEADLTLGKCRYLVEQLLKRGYAVVLTTIEERLADADLGVVMVNAPVRNSEELAERLANAAAGHSSELLGSSDGPVLLIDFEGLQGGNNVGAR